MKPNRKEGGVYMPIAVVSGADRNIGLEIVKQFLQRGWKVFAGRYLMELPLLEAGKGRRICCVTTVQSSNNAARDCADYPAHVSKAPLNMAMNPAVQRPAPERIHLPDVLQGSRSRAGKGGRIRSGILYPQPQQRSGILQAFRREPPCAARLDEH